MNDIDPAEIIKAAIFDVDGDYSGSYEGARGNLTFFNGERYLLWRTEWTELSLWRPGPPITAPGGFSMAGPVICDMPNLSAISYAPGELISA